MLVAAIGVGIAPLKFQAAEAPLRVHIVSGAKEYASESSLKAYAAHLEARFRAQITASWVADGATSLPGIDALEIADVLIVFARRLKVAEDQMKLVRQHWERGKPVIGIRTASHAFGQADNEIFDRQVLGGNYQGHFGDEPVQVQPAPNASDHPVLQGVDPFVSQKLYKAGELPKQTTVLQNGRINNARTHPVTWVNEYRGGRMFYTSLGVPADFKQPEFIRLLDNAVRWVTRRSVARQ